MCISNVRIVVFSLLQVAASTNKEVDAHIPNYPNLPPQLVCQLHNVTMHVSSVIWCIMVLWVIFFFYRQPFKSSITCVIIQADVETDEVYAQMTLQPLSPVVNFPSLSPVCQSCKHFLDKSLCIARAKGCLSAC